MYEKITTESNSECSDILVRDETFVRLRFVGHSLGLVRQKRVVVLQRSILSCHPTLMLKVEPEKHMFIGGVSTIKIYIMPSGLLTANKI